MSLLPQGGTSRNNPLTKASARREQIRRLSDSRLYQLQRKLEAEARRRRDETAEGIHKDDPRRIQWWRPCPICHDRACCSQVCRDAERLAAQRG